MHCIKCGRDIEEGQVFCADCLEVMGRYPVKPGIAIQLPNRKDAPAQKKAHPKRRQGPKPEEQVRRLRKWLVRVIILWIITLGLLAGTIYPTVEYYMGKAFPVTGQNYTTVTSQEPTQP